VELFQRQRATIIDIVLQRLHILSLSQEGEDLVSVLQALVTAMDVNEDPSNILFEPGFLQALDPAEDILRSIAASHELIPAFIRISFLAHQLVEFLLVRVRSILRGLYLWREPDDLASRLVTTMAKFFKGLWSRFTIEQMNTKIGPLHQLCCHPPILVGL
jgi:hypothetical protein